MPITSLGLQADKKEGSNAPATPATSVLCCSPESTALISWKGVSESNDVGTIAFPIS